MKNFNDMSEEEILETVFDGEMANLLMLALSLEGKYKVFKAKKLREVMKLRGKK